MKRYRISYNVGSREYTHVESGLDGRNALHNMLEKYGIHISLVYVHSIVEVE